MYATLLFTTGATVFVTLVFLAFFNFVKPAMVDADHERCRGGWSEAHENHCEQGLLRIPQQPVNTYSNLAYFVAGMVVMVELDTMPAFVFAITMTYMCIGSTLYHALCTRWAGMLDVTGIYAVYSAMAVYAVSTVSPRELPGDVLAMVMFSVAGGVTLALSPRFRRHMNFVIGCFLGITYLFLLANLMLARESDTWRLLLSSFLLFALAFVIWRVDRRRAFPLKRWGHGFWHILTAAGTTLLYHAIDRAP